MKKIMIIFGFLFLSSAMLMANPLPDTNWIKDVGAGNIYIRNQVFYVNDFGAVNDGKTMSTSFIQKAIDACAAKGGGIVAFKPGTYLTGSIFVKSNVELRIDSGVTIIGSQHIEDYPMIPTRVAGIEMQWPAALINVIQQHNVRITGHGIIDGRGKPFWDSYWNLRKVYDPKGLRWAADYDCKRPRLILISRSNHVELSQLHLQRSGFWTVHILYSDHVTVNGITIQNNIGGHGPSTDGVDIDSSTRILVENCDVDCNDDDYCLKAGRDADGLRVNKPTEYVVIRNCIARHGGGLITFGSETSGSIRHVLVEHSKAIGTSNGVNFKSAFTRGGTVEDVYIHHIQMEDVNTAIRFNLNWNPNYSYTSLPAGINPDSIPDYWKVMLQKVPPSKGTPTIRDVYIADVRATNCTQGIYAAGMQTSPIQSITLKNIQIEAQNAGTVQYARNWKAIELQITSANHKPVQLEHTENVNL
ncbi:glycoside hydrolase family 28 protein [Thermoflavifilum thermophilum]|uniref:Glycosyl hydrolases family 28 n=1 Tax=Thermoflavifilum thermophilum TaxID=1393122 RepID=A0A1I7NIX6_9BACT|nr:glycosyl hydrolase family 28 protein [Thermoflavifilum thermophilum]SFV34600.1 Glycosyl hydrolases family 28 [Thermoflavifilum thermophilum]